MTTITRQELDKASVVVSRWIDEDVRNYAGLADMLRNAELDEQSVGVIILELMSATKLSDWKNVLSGLAGRQLVDPSEHGDANITAADLNADPSVWEQAYTKWETRYRDTPETEWALGNTATPEVQHAVTYYRHFYGEHVATALDLGAGDGRNAVFLAENNFTITAIDGAQEAINRLEKRLADAPHTTLYCADLADCELPVGFDIVVASYILHLLPDPYERLNQWQAAVRPGGLIAISSRGRMHFDPPEYWFPPAGAIQHYFELRGWEILSTREATEFRPQMGMFRHTAVVARKPESDHM
jgi:SAM-dependent methyltransferase